VFVFVIFHSDRPHVALDTAETLEDVVAALTARPEADLTVCVNHDGLTRSLAEGRMMDELRGAFRLSTTQRSVPDGGEAVTLCRSRLLKGPQNGPQRPFCGPFAVQIPTNGREQARTASREAQRFRGFSPVFACARGTLRNRGEGFTSALLSHFSAFCGPFAVPIPGPLQPVRAAPGVAGRSAQSGAGPRIDSA
jgi:hypothetical protein